MGNGDSEVSATHSDFGETVEVKKVPAARKDRRKNRTGAIGRYNRKLKGMVSGYLTKSVSMRPRGENAARMTTLRDLGEIGKLKWIEGSRLEFEHKIEELEDRMAISD